ncbi:DUF7010 family protein [Pseudomarimonas salicorniae]|uniref:Uncharacterized protein n=1 Tax=Pseudomarimonas salicorniae TaxID=2933270 RepID=A0ABT0GIH9_9GAMM|nr:hypothetical protein [Lysobacter sp. CAU 1642]MCK7594348.1 hypothetical protein [Lysobacter sp. CAU 1642]
MDADTSLAAAQQDMRHGFMEGGPGVLASAIVWLVAGGFALYHSPQAGVIALFVGGMLIHPLGMLGCRLLGRPGAQSTGNPLTSLALASTAWMLLCLPLAYAAFLVRPEWFFPAMLLLIGGRYLCFHTLYGRRGYLVLGAALGAAGWLLAATGASPSTGAWAGGAIEAAFGIYLLARPARLAAA